LITDGILRDWPIETIKTARNEFGVLVPKDAAIWQLRVIVGMESPEAFELFKQMAVTWKGLRQRGDSLYGATLMSWHTFYETEGRVVEISVRRALQSLDGGGQWNGYLSTVCDYVHLNPVRAKLIQADARLESFRWSSYGHYLKPPGQRPSWLRVDRLLGEKGIPRDSGAGREQFARLMEQRRKEEAAADHRGIRRGWCLGSEAFRQELLAAAVERVGPSHYGAHRQESDEQKAQRLVAAGIKRLGWQEADLQTRRKGDQEKVLMARRLRQETTMSLKWIARRLGMGSWTYVFNLLNEKPQTATLCK
jgi:hypothetical protein